MKFLKKAMFFALLPLIVQNLWGMDDYTKIPPTPPRAVARPSSPSKTTPLLDKTGRSSFGATDVFPLTDITAEARRLSDVHIFTTNALHRNRITTSLNKMLGAHDDLIRLLESAKAMRLDITNKKVISKDTFNHLKIQEKALRKMIHLTWGALMLHDEGDIGEFRKEKKAPFLFDGQGFEQKKPRELTRYSFPDKGDTRVYVAQIREIARILNIDMNAEFNLHFDPIAKEIRKKMVKAYEEDTRTTGDGYLCMRSLLRPGRSESVGGHDEPRPSKSGGRGSVGSLSDPLSSDEMSRAANLVKFKLFMNETIAREIDGSRVRALILRINDRLRGAYNATEGLSADGVVIESRAAGAPRLEEGKDQDEDGSPLVLAGSDPFNHPAFEALPFGTPFKPITTSAYSSSERILRGYWEKTELILNKAQKMISEDMEIYRRIAETLNTDLDNRATQLIIGVLWRIQKHVNSLGRTDVRMSPLVTKMLENLNIPAREAPFYGDSMEELKPSNAATKDEAYNYLLGENPADLKMHILDDLEKEFTRLITSF